MENREKIVNILIERLVKGGRTRLESLEFLRKTAVNRLSYVSDEKIYNLITTDLIIINKIISRGEF